MYINILTDTLFLVHQFGLFEFRTGRDSRPSTPSMRSKAAIFGLDAISRNLFSSRSGTSMGDFFGGSISGHKRTKSTTSRSSMYTQTTSTGDGSMKFSHRSNSTATAATTMSAMDDDSSFFASRSSKGRSLLKRGKSTGGSTSDCEQSPSRTHSRRSRSESRVETRNRDFNEHDDDNGTILAKPKSIDSSEYNLALQLELARQNSLSQHAKQPAPLEIEIPLEETIYEGPFVFP